MTTPKLPTWTDAQSVTSYLVTIIGLVTFVLATFGVAVPARTGAVLPAVGALIAAAVQAVNVITHRSAHAKAAQVKPWQAAA